MFFQPTREEEVVGDLFPLKGNGTDFSGMTTISIGISCGKGEYSVGFSRKIPK
jgi:hypothetical protein